MRLRCLWHCLCTSFTRNLHRAAKKYAVPITYDSALHVRTASSRERHLHVLISRVMLHLVIVFAWQNTLCTEAFRTWVPSKQGISLFCTVIYHTCMYTLPINDTYRCTSSTGKRAALCACMLCVHAVQVAAHACELMKRLSAPMLTLSIDQCDQ